MIISTLVNGSFVVRFDSDGTYDASKSGDAYWHYNGNYSVKKSGNDYYVQISQWGDYSGVKLYIMSETSDGAPAYLRGELGNGGVIDLRRYNIIHSDDCLKRIVIAFDEVAEVLDKTGLDKDQKAKVMKVEELLATIARLGRAFGIHLILSTQRPDANILSGQIRNNIDGRYCGRADDVLSKIILDNTLASEEIPKNEQGLFLAQDGTVLEHIISMTKDFNQLFQSGFRVI